MPKISKMDESIHHLKDLAAHQIRDAHDEPCPVEQHTVPIIEPRVYALAVQIVERESEEE